MWTVQKEEQRVELVFSTRTVPTLCRIFCFFFFKLFLHFLKYIYIYINLHAQRWLLPKAASLPLPFLSADKMVVGFSKRCMMM